MCSGGGYRSQTGPKVGISSMSAVFPISILSLLLDVLASESSRILPNYQRGRCQEQDQRVQQQSGMLAYARGTSNVGRGLRTAQAT